MKKILFLFLFFASCAFSLPVYAQEVGSFEVGNKVFLLDGKPFVIKAAEIHYPRIPREYWEHRIKMCKALGMNTLCIYIFWNIHEQQEDCFDWSGNNDVAEFCRLAQKHGMYVIVRPGPYVCAEWEMGGLPWWLLKKKDIRLRENDSYFMERVRKFETQVGKQLASLTIQNGGPIIMVQVENEYGSYGVDKEYVGRIRDCLRSVGFDKVTLFQCDWASNFLNNGLDDLVWTMNFGTGADIQEQFRKLREVRPSSPLMCSEFWSGWFDKWGARHETRSAEAMVDGIREMLDKGISFSLYMTHGGTSFGQWAGANSPGFAPDVTSYDYDAPINECGQPTEKFWLLRETMKGYADKKNLPDVPKPPLPLIAVPKFKLSEFVPIEYGIDNTVESYAVKSMEQLDMGWGTLVYETVLPEIATQSVLMLNECHDFAMVYIDGRYVGSIDRVKNEKSITLKPIIKGQRLTILVEAMGRINFGRAIKDFKGITENVVIRSDVDGHELSLDLKNWKISTIPLTYDVAIKALDASAQKTSYLLSSSGYYRGAFYLKRPGDTFINMESFGKGMVYVNGHALGRFWNIGPQQTLYVPGCWLHKGRNEVVVLDVIGPKGEPTVFCQDKPELDKLNIVNNVIHNNPHDCPDLSSLIPVVDTNVELRNGWQTIEITNPVNGRYLAIECCSTHASDQVAIAELFVKDINGNRLTRESWTVKYADSENEAGNHTGEKVFDLQESTFWQTKSDESFPHILVLDLGSEQSVKAIDYLPRSEPGTPGCINHIRIFVYS